MKHQRQNPVDNKYIAYTLVGVVGCNQAIHNSPEVCWSQSWGSLSPRAQKPAKEASLWYTWLMVSCVPLESLVHCVEKHTHLPC